MKKLIFITIMLLSTLVCAYKLGSYEIDYETLPIKSGTYYACRIDLQKIDGTYIKVGDIYEGVWGESEWYKYHLISCKITDFYSTYSHSCPYHLVINCSVNERTQFVRANVTYYDLKGFRANGTLKWSRDSIASTDIYCYDKSGMTAVKHVNDPYYCK